MLNSSAINCICIFDVSSSPNAGENGTPSSPKNWGMARCLALTMQRWEPRSLSWYLYQWSWVTWMTWMLFLYVHKVCVYIYMAIDKWSEVVSQHYWNHMKITQIRFIHVATHSGCGAPGVSLPRPSLPLAAAGRCQAADGRNNLSMLRVMKDIRKLHSFSHGFVVWIFTEIIQVRTKHLKSCRFKVITSALQWCVDCLVGLCIPNLWMKCAMCYVGSFGQVLTFRYRTWRLQLMCLVCRFSL